MRVGYQNRGIDIFDSFLYIMLIIFGVLLMVLFWPITVLFFIYRFFRSTILYLYNFIF